MLMLLLIFVSMNCINRLQWLRFWAIGERLNQQLKPGLQRLQNKVQTKYERIRFEASLDLSICKTQTNAQD